MSTYKKPHKRFLPKVSKTIPIHGTGEDENRYYRCWNCGFVCDSQRDELGDSESEAGDEHKDFANLVSQSTLEGFGGNLACLGGPIGHYHTALVLGFDGEPQGVRHDMTSDISRGCPFCGTVNYRGDY